MFKEYVNYDGLGLAGLIKNKEISAAEILESAIEQIEKFNPQLNAVIYKMFDTAQKEAVNFSIDSPFAGVPFLLKDLGLQLKGHPTTNASHLTKDHRALVTSDLVKLYQNSGLCILGKTNTSEFGILGATESELFGSCKNPWNLNLNSGGSSGGSAAAVASRMVPIASGEDGGGSIRIPASACGLFGFKPSRGFQSFGPDKTEGWLGLSSSHVVTRSVRDSAKIFDLTQLPGIGAPYGPLRGLVNASAALGKSVKGMKVAFSKQSLLGETTHPDGIEALEKTLKICESLGMIVVEAKPEINKQELIMSFLIIVAASISGELYRYEKLFNQRATYENIEGPTLFLKIAGEKISALELEKALFVARKATQTWEHFLQSYDFFCTPTLAYPIDENSKVKLSMIEKQLVRIINWLPSTLILKILKEIGIRGIEKTPNTSLFNMSGHPAMSVPTYWNKDNLPIGVQFVGRMGADDTLFSLASALEAEVQWNEKKPSLIL